MSYTNRAKINAGLMTWITGSTGSPGHMVLGSLGRWVTKCDPVPCLEHTIGIQKYDRNEGVSSEGVFCEGICRGGLSVRRRLQLL